MRRHDYGTGSVWYEKKSRKWRAQIRIGNERRSIGMFDTHEAAEASLVLAIKRRKELSLAGPITLRTYGDQWLERCARAGMRDIRNMRSRWSTVVCDAPFIDLPIRSIMRPEIRDWAKGLVNHPAKRAVMEGGKSRTIELSKTISWQTAKNALSLLHSCLQDALDHYVIDVNPSDGVRPPKRLEKSEGWTHLSVAEIDAVLSLPLSDEQRTVFTVTIYQGLRDGEVAALEWEDIDLDSATMIIKASWHTATKSGRVRRIPILPPAIAALRLWRPEHLRHGIVFPSPSGERYSRGYVWGWDERRYGGEDIPTRAGISRRVRFHDLRHTCGSRLISGSWGPAWTAYEVRDFLGHRSVKTTERYAHLAPDSLSAKAKMTATALHEHRTAKIVTIRRK